MRRLLTGALSRALWLAGHALIGALLVLVAGLAVYVRGLPPLDVWHRASLDEEFTAESDVRDFAAYLALEDRLFAQLDEAVIARVPTGPDQAINRFSRGSLADPGRWPRDWNRSFEIRNERPAAAVVLLHGLSDSPYSMRALATSLADRGASVVGLRIPGHGTAPSALLDVRWQDMAAAVRIAVEHAATLAAGKSLYLVGYSNGGALAVEYALSALADPSLPQASRIVLLSPEIGVTELAFLAAWQRRLGRVLGLEKLAWNSIEPEYDPFKYNSFAVNAGALAHDLTGHIQAQIDALGAGGALARMPRLLAFQSSVDATVTAGDLVSHLFARLPPAGHELVLFDINRRAGIAPLLKRDPRTVFRPMLASRDLGFDLTIVTNESDSSASVVAKTMRHGSTEVSQVPLEEGWPEEVYSLAHIALPFAPEDPLYGGPQAAPSPGMALGDVALRGERGVLWVSGGALLRMHWNPFFGYVRSRVADFLELPAR